jgi:hypothetical protein
LGKGDRERGREEEGKTVSLSQAFIMLRTFRAFSGSDFAKSPSGRCFFFAESALGAYGITS